MPDEREDIAVTDNQPATDKRIGQVLAEKRKALGKSLTDVKDAIGINVEYLAALENMYAADIPSGYINGYLRAYAKFLSMDADHAIEQFKTQCGLISDAEDKKLEDLNRVRRSNAMRSMMAAGGVAAGVILAIGATIAMVLSGNPAPLEADTVVDNRARDSLFETAVREELEPQFPLSLTALESAWVEVRGEDGTIFRSRIMNRGETYYPRIGAGWTVSARNGAAFEWRVGDVPIGKLSEEVAAVYALSIDAAAADAKEATQPALVSGSSEPRASN